MMTFSEALSNIKNRERVARSGWNGKGMWLILLDPDDYSVEAYARFNSDRLLPYIAMRTADGGLVPWLASQTDILADDWLVV